MAPQPGQAERLGETPLQSLEAAGGSLRRLRRRYFGTTWPRISPPGLALVWTLTYHLPARRSAIWSSVSTLEPVAGLGTLPMPIGTTTGALAPGVAGPWKCAAVASPVSPL